MLFSALKCDRSSQFFLLNQVIKMQWTKSKEAFDRANDVFPGGVNSPVRAFRSVGGSPPFIARAAGSHLWDVDGNKYIDYVGAWGPAILGHAHPQVVAAVAAAAANGLCYGAPSEGETALAHLIQKAFPSVEKMRLVSSGTEACMSAIRLARAFTKRQKILKFSGCYHGHADMLLAKAGSGVATFGLPDSAGVPEEVARHTLTATYNALGEVEEGFIQNRGQIAAVILEPIVGNSGFIRGESAFIAGLAQLCKREGALLIFDEVMTGFRVAWGGAQSIYGLKPDLTTLGKVVGGGLPLAVYGGRRDIMDLVAPIGPMYQAGTLSGNPVAVASGRQTLELLGQHRDFTALSRFTRRLVDGLQEIAAARNIPFTGDCEGGMFGFFFQATVPRSYEEAQLADKNRFISFFHGMLENGVYLAPSMFEAGFVSLAHTEKDLEATLKAAATVMATLS